jgi:hypothetical protein
MIARRSTIGHGCAAYPDQVGQVVLRDCELIRLREIMKPSAHPLLDCVAGVARGRLHRLGKQNLLVPNYQRL